MFAYVLSAWMTISMNDVLVSAIMCGGADLYEEWSNRYFYIEMIKFCLVGGIVLGIISVVFARLYIRHVYAHYEAHPQYVGKRTREYYLRIAAHMEQSYIYSTLCACREIAVMFIGFGVVYAVIVQLYTQISVIQWVMILIAQRYFV